MKKSLQIMKMQAAFWRRAGLLGLAGLLAGPVTAQNGATKLYFQKTQVALGLPLSGSSLIPVSGIQYATVQQVSVPKLQNAHKISAAISSTAAGGSWSAPTTWVGGVVPGSADNVTIVAGATVTLDVVASTGSLIIESTASLLTSATTNFKLEVSGNVTNNGILDLSTSASIGSDLRFVGAGNATFSGTGTTDLHTMSLAKAVRADIVEMNLPTLSVKGSTTTGDGFLFTRTTATPAVDDMTGTLKISGTATITNKVFGNAASYFIPATGGFWLNNPNFTVTGQLGTATVNGTLQITTGTYNVGTSSGNSLVFGANSFLTMQGGTLSSAGRVGSFTGAATAAPMTLTMSGGVINVATVGNAAATPSFGIGGNSIVSGGSINLVQRSTNAVPVDYYQASLTGFTASAFTGGTLNIGTAATTTNFDFRIKGSVPNLTVDNTGTAKTALLTAQTNVFGSVLVNTGATLNLNGFLLLQIGPAITNNGTFTGTTTGSRLYFQGTTAQTLGGTGTYTNPIAQVTFQNSGAGVTLNAPISTRNVAMFRGNVTNAANLTIGDGTALAVLSFGLTNPTASAGNFDVRPTYNLSATTGLYLIYNPELAPRTIGVEIPANRTVYYMDVNNPQGLTLSGGNLTVAGDADALTLVSGIFTTSPANTLIIGANSTVMPTGSATSYVKGPLGITVNSATAVSRTFAVGDAAGWRPVVVGGITTASPQTFIATVVNGATGGAVSGPISSLNPTRYVRLENTANLPATATIQLSYGTGDVIGAPATAVIAQAATANGTYVSLGGAPATVPTTGIVSTQNITPGSDFFVIANTEGGTLATSVATVCSGTNTGTLTLTGLATGATILGYEANTGSGFVPVSGTNTASTYAFTNLSATTTFRAALRSADNRDIFSAPVTVTVNPSANAGFAYSGSTFCLSGTNPTATISGTTGGTFSSTTGLSLNATTGTINLAASTPGTYTVTYSVAGTCPATATTSVTITSAPSATFSYPATSFCTNGTNPAPTFSGSSSAGSFSAGTGLSINAATGVINLAASTPGTYTVTNAIAASGGCSAASATSTITINAVPAALGQITGPATTPCANQGNVTYSVAAGTNVTSYNWNVPAGWTITAGQGTSTITVTAGTAGGNVSVTGINNCGNGTASTSAAAVNANPTPAITGLSASYCKNAAAVTLTSNLTGSTFTIDGTAATSFNPAALSVGNHVVVVSNTNAGGCTGTATQNVAVVATPATPVITQNGGVLTSSAATGNQWYLNGNQITGATGQVYTTTANGSYTVIATANGCPSAASAPINMIATGIKDDLAGMKVSVYPNPTNGTFNVQLSGYQVNATITLYNLTGQAIAVENVKAGEEIKAMNVKGLAAGTYLLKVASDKGVQVSRVLVQ